MLLYLAVVCAITAWLIFETYRSAKQGVYRELKLYQNTFSKPLTDNLWSLDMMKLSSLVRGILQTQAIVGVRIVDPNDGQTLARSGWVIGYRQRPGHDIIIEMASLLRLRILDPPSDIFEYSFPLVHKIRQHR